MRHNRQFHHLDRKSAEKSIILDWNGVKPTAKNKESVWSAHLGGVVDRSLCQTKLVKHQRHWDPTTNTRGNVTNTSLLLKIPGAHNPLHYVQKPVTMVTSQRDRERRKADPLLDCSPSLRHGSIQFVRPLGLKRTKHHAKREFNFKYGKLCGSQIHDPNVDHPKHGTPFKTQQIVRTILDRTIDKLEKELRSFPDPTMYGMTAQQQKPKAAVEMALGEYLRVREETTGAKARELMKKVASAKKRIKAKLGMMTALKSKGFGDFSFLDKIKNELNNQTHLKPVVSKKK